MKYYIYILESLKDKEFYVGMTKNVAHRLHEHNLGQVRSTRSRMPFQLIHTEEVENRKLARVREKYWKSGAGREKLRRMINLFALPKWADLPMGKSC